MQKLLAATAALALALSAAPAFADGTTDLYAANTVVATGANGAVLRFKFDANGSYTMTAGDQSVAGTWAIEAGQFCLTPQGGQKSCSPHSATRKVGDTWTVTGADSVQYSVTLVAGR